MYRPMWNLLIYDFQLQINFHWCSHGGTAARMTGLLIWLGPIVGFLAKSIRNFEGGRYVEENTQMCKELFGKFFVWKCRSADNIITVQIQESSQQRNITKETSRFRYTLYSVTVFLHQCMMLKLQYLQPNSRVVLSLWRTSSTFQTSFSENGTLLSVDILTNLYKCTVDVGTNRDCC